MIRIYPVPSSLPFFVLIHEVAQPCRVHPPNLLLLHPFPKVLETTLCPCLMMISSLTWSDLIYWMRRTRKDNFPSLPVISLSLSLSLASHPASAHVADLDR
jgi:hypothetical protein